MLMTGAVPELNPDEPAAQTVGEEDHENIETFIGEEADRPEDTGKPPADGAES
jgi:hypothetical protein